MVNRLRPGQELAIGDSLWSSNGRARLVMQHDGNLVLYHPHGAKWHSNTVGLPVTKCILQTDSNFVLYTNKGPVWDSRTCCQPGGELILQNDGNVVIYRGGSAIWHTNSWVRCINLHVKILTSPTRFTIDQMIQGMSQVYSKAGYFINIQSTENLNLPLLTDLDIGECLRGQTTAEQNQLFGNRNNVGNNEIVVYLIRSTNPPTNGCAAHPNGQPSCVVTSGASRWTFGHEVGHVLNLVHVNNNDRLMTGNGTNNITNPPPDIVNTEISTIRSTVFPRVCAG